MISDYANSHGLSIDRFYIDDGITGFTYNRPSWNKLMEDVDLGLVDTIIIKDLSRLGRKNGLTLVLLDELKEKGKNLIVLNGIAGGVYNLQKDSDDTVGITTWYNERYVKDISCKVKSSMRSRQKSGKLIMGNKFGYLKDKKDKSKLVVDEDIRPIIKDIYHMYINERLGYIPICKRLNEKGYITPSMYYQKKAFENGVEYKGAIQTLWCTYMVTNILKNEIYTGTLVTHKKEAKTIRGRTHLLKEDEYYRFPNHHEAIISEREFLLAKEIRENKGNNSSITIDKDKYLFRGLIKCGECGFSVTGRMIKRKNYKMPGYACTTYIKYGSKRCKCKEVREDYLVAYIKEMLKETREKYARELSEIKLNNIEERMKKELKEINKNKKNKEEELKLLIFQKIKDINKQNDNVSKEIIDESYDQLIEQKRREILTLKEQAIKLEKNCKEKYNEKMDNILNVFDKIINDKILDKNLLQNLIDKIYLYNDNSIKIDLKVNIDKLCV